MLSEARASSFEEVVFVVQRKSESQRLHLVFAPPYCPITTGAAIDCFLTDGKKIRLGVIPFEVTIKSRFTVFRLHLSIAYH